MNGKRWLALGIAGLLVIGSIVVNITTSFIFGDATRAFDFFNIDETEVSENVVENGNPDQKIAVLSVEGVIQDTATTGGLLQSSGYQHKMFMKQLERVKEDNTVKGMVLYVNSPGGGVVESAQIHDKLIDIQETTGKPVYVSMGSVAASGGYYIAAPADRIFASPETLTGSLGVIMQSWNFDGLAEQYGVDLITVKSGPYKDIMNPVRELTEDERAILETMVENSYKGFVDVIANGREMNEEEVRDLADGRIYDGRQAMENGLIDEFGYLEDVINQLKEEHGLDRAQVVEYSSINSVLSLLEVQATEWFATGKELHSLTAWMNEYQSPRLMYLYTQ